MPKYQVDIPHTLAADEAKKRIAGATSKLEKDYGATCTWKSEQRAVRVAQGAGRARDRGSRRACTSISNLGFLLTPFAERIKAGIAKQLTGILASDLTASHAVASAATAAATSASVASGPPMMMRATPAGGRSAATRGSRSPRPGR